MEHELIGEIKDGVAMFYLLDWQSPESWLQEIEDDEC
jgi:hypothetical protein